VARARGVTLYVLVLTALYLLIRQHTGADDLIVGSPVADRNEGRFDDVIGYFINMVPLRVDFGGDPTWPELFERVRRTVLSALEHPGYPLQMLVQNLKLPRSASRSPLFQITLNLHRSHRSSDLVPFFLNSFTDETIDFGGSRLRPFPLAQQQGQFDLSLEFTEVEGKIGGRLNYHTDLFRRSTAERILEEYLSVLRRVAENSEDRISAWDMNRDEIVI
jgi:non-ribosomal peptide synthetase component F